MKPTCSICLEPYNTTTLRPVVGFCGHTLCLPCSKKIKKACPTCRRLSFASPVPNYGILTLLESKASDEDDDADDGCCHKKFKSKMYKMEKKYTDMVKSIKDDFTAQLKELKEQNARSSLDIQNIYESISVLNGNMAYVDDLNQNVNVLNGNFERFKEEMRGRRKRNADDPPDEEDRPGPSTKNSRMDEPEIETVHTCFLCGTPFPKETSLRQDGVSSECVNENCQCLNIIADLLEGNKWIVMECNGPADPHFQQIPINTADKLWQCQVCNEIADYSTAADWVIAKTEETDAGADRNVPSTSGVRPIRPRIVPIRYSPDTDDAVPGASGFSLLDTVGPSSPFGETPQEAGAGSSNTEVTGWVATMRCVHCRDPLPMNLPLREDGVSVRCPTQKHLNIVGKLRKGNRWMMMVCADVLNPHFTQVSAVRKPGDLQKCRLCKKSGKLLDASDRTALPL